MATQPADDCALHFVGKNNSTVPGLPARDIPLDEWKSFAADGWDGVAVLATDAYEAGPACPKNLVKAAAKLADTVPDASPVQPAAPAKE